MIFLPSHRTLLSADDEADHPLIQSPHSVQLVLASNNRLAGSYLRLRGWQLNNKRVNRLWCLNGLSLPPYRPRRKIRTGARLDGPARNRNDVWAWDFVHDRYNDKEPLGCLTIKDEATGYRLAIKTGRHLRHLHVKATLEGLVTRFGLPKAIRSDNGSELLAGPLREEMKNYGVRLANIEPGKPWQNGSNESFNGTFRKEYLNAEIFTSLTEARVIIEKWRRRHNERRPHRSLGKKPRAVFAREAA